MSVRRRVERDDAIPLDGAVLLDGIGSVGIGPNRGGVVD